MAESHAISNLVQVNGSLKILGSDFKETSKINELSAPAHSRSGSSDSGEGLLLSASDLQAQSNIKSGVRTINNNHETSSQSIDQANCCDYTTESLKNQAMGQAGNTAKSTLIQTCSDQGTKDGVRLPTDIDNTDGSMTSRQLPNVDMSKSVAFARLESELASAQTLLKLREEEVDKLSKIREEVESELHDLTASLFQEAHRMVQEANVKAASSERCLMEAEMKIDGLETEVAALKTLVLTSTPARPNRHLLQAKNDSRSRPSSASSTHLSAMASPALNGSSGLTGNGSLSTGTLIVGAGGLLGAKSEDLFDETSSWNCCCSDVEVEREKYIDPGLRKDFLAWKKEPSFDRGTSDFLERLYKEDIDLCLDFPNAELSRTLRSAVERNALCINPLSVKEFEDNTLPNSCALFEAPILCRFHVRLLPIEGAESSDEEKNSEIDFYVCQLARNRIISVCDCLTYLRYIKQGMVKSHHNDVYWQILEYRKKMALARLGFAPD